ncbi:MAG: hypothetical protein ACMX3H_04060 [Sodalis sp. (in: enterobacteria)]|uniref:hypothetical protein n=1 Tax=Sodalis sp. (in: enterobacteria) TaxID=1898979 RepID=UPI0039E5FB25
MTRLLGMKAEIIVPESGVLSSLGLLSSDLKNDFSVTCILRKRPVEDVLNYWWVCCMRQ